MRKSQKEEIEGLIHQLANDKLEGKSLERLLQLKKEEPAIEREIRFDLEVKTAIEDESKLTHIKKLIIGIGEEEKIQPDFDNLDEINAIHQKTVFKNNINWFKTHLHYILTGALLVIGGVIGYQYFYQNDSTIAKTAVQTPSEISPISNELIMWTEEEMKQHYKSRIVGGTASLQKGMQEYKTKKYETAIASLEAYKKENTTLYKDRDSYIDFYIGISYLYLKEPNVEQAIKQFTFKEPHPQYIIVNKWFLALAYVKNNELDKAIDLFLELSQLDSSYGNQLSLLLEGYQDGKFVEVTGADQEEKEIRQKARKALYLIAKSEQELSL